jgi:hypothetical protein
MLKDAYQKTTVAGWSYELSSDWFLEVDCVRIVLVLAKGAAALKTPTVVQANRFDLIDSGLEP